MDQRKVRLLLEEYANPTCPFKRQVGIQQLLTSALYQDRAQAEDEDADQDPPGQVLRAVLASLLVETKRNRPDALLGLFPAFALLCGDRDAVGDYFTTVEWENVP